MHIEIVLGRVVLAREEGGPKDSARTKPAVSEDHVAPEVVPTDEAVDGHYPADAFGLAVTDAHVRRGVDLSVLERRVHSSPLKRTTASSARAPEGRATPTGTPGPGAESPGG